jgi:hypothetical protein
MKSSCLHVSFNDIISTGHNIDKFVITKEIRNNESTGNKNPEEWFSELSKIEFDNEKTFTYTDFLPHIIGFGKLKLPIYISFYELLSEKIEEKNYSNIIVHEMPKPYRLVIEDIVNETSISIHRECDEKTKNSWTRSRINVLIFILDQIFVLIRRLFILTESQKDRQHLFFPFPDRYDSLLPIIKNLNESAHTIVTPLFVSWQYLASGDNWPSNIRASPLTEHTTISNLIYQIKNILAIEKSVYYRDFAVANDLAKYISKNHDIKMEYTIKFLISKMVRNNYRQILSLILMKHIISGSQCQNVIIGGDAPRDRYTARIGDKKQKQIFHVPHSIQYRSKIPLPAKCLIQFLPGEPDRRLLEKSYSGDQLPKLIVSGRPYFNTLNTSKKKSTESNKIIIGTQPYSNWIRNKFVKKCLAQIQRSDFIGKVIIKIHPSENRPFYQNIINNLENKQQIDVETGPVQDYITDNTCMITINSNVGLESILLGAYCISFNPFEPFIQKSSYIDEKLVPYITSDENLSKQISDVFVPNLETEQQKIQTQYIKKNYIFEDTIESIVANIKQHGVE